MHSLQSAKKQFNLLPPPPQDWLVTVVTGIYHTGYLENWVSSLTVANYVTGG